MVAKKSELELVLKKLEKMIYGYETLYGMELLGTVLWVCKENENQSLNDVIAHVQSWNPRKKAIMSDQDITTAYTHLMNCGIIG